MDSTTALSTLKNAFVEGLGTAADSILDFIGGALPIALTVAGVVIAVKFGIKFFKSTAK